MKLYITASLWVRDITEMWTRIESLALCDWRDDPWANLCTKCPGEKLCNMAPAAPGREA